MKLYKANPPHDQPDHDQIYQLRVRTREWWGNCGPVEFPIFLEIEEARRIRKRWWGWEPQCNWYKTGPDTYTQIGET